MLSWIRRSHTVRRSMAALALGSLTLAGCAPGPRASVDPNDPCATQRSTLVNAQNFFAESIIKGAVGGAMAGALGGALIGAATGQDIGQAALIGAAAGGVAGAAGGYFQARQRQQQDTAALARQINEDIRAEVQEINRATVGFVSVKRCRLDEAQRIRNAFEAGTMDRATAQARLDDLRANFAEEIQIAKEMGVRMTERAQEFQYASNQLMEQDPQARQELIKWQEQEGVRTYQEPAAAQALAPPAPPTLTAGDFDFPNRFTHRVNKNGNLRAGPGTNYERLATWDAGTEVIAVRHSSNWYAVKLQGDTVAYMWHNLLDPIGSAPAEAPAPSGTLADAAPADPPPVRVAESDEEAVVAVGQNTTETLPYMRETFVAEVDDAEQQLDVAFNLDPVATTGRLLLPAGPVPDRQFGRHTELPEVRFG